MGLDAEIPKNLILALNLTLGSIIITGLLLTNYTKKYIAICFKHNLFLGIVILNLAAIIVFFFLLLFGLIPSGLVFFLMFFFPCTIAVLLYLFFSVLQSNVRVDPLTGLGNRFSFSEFTIKLARHKSGESWAFIMIDMDKFKHINDTLGHQEGDNALQSMSQIIKSCIKKSDYAVRYGGDEFVVATKIEKGDDSNVINLIDEIQSAVDRFNMSNVSPFKLEISYGCDVYTQDGKRSVNDFMNHIDNLMYKHKQERRRSSDKTSGTEK